MQLLNFVPFGLPQICKGQVRVTYVLCVVLHANGRIYVYIYIYEEEIGIQKQNALYC